ncbi:MAG TPA: flagellar hook-length control protein FliK [Solirubrobacteraceae bacterium]
MSSSPRDTNIPPPGASTSLSGPVAASAPTAGAPGATAAPATAGASTIGSRGALLALGPPLAEPAGTATVRSRAGATNVSPLGQAGLRPTLAAVTTPAAESSSLANLATLDAGTSPNPGMSVGGTGPDSGGNGLPFAGLQMQETIDSIGATIELAARQGIVKARIELQPEELGHISIRLSQTNEGLRARVTAETPAGAQALNQGRSELRQSLDSLGLSLLQLDIGSSGQPRSGERDQNFAGNVEGPSALSATDAVEESKTLGDHPDDARPVGSPLGEIVDVLA